MKLWLRLALALAILGASATVVQADDSGRQAVVYYNEACDECVVYVEGELAEIMAAHQITLIKKDYINQREHRRELNELNDRLNVPLELQSHLATYIDDGRIILQGEPPRHIVESLLTPNADLPERILVYAEEGEEKSYKVWAFAGPVKSYPADTPIETYLTWFEANRNTFAEATEPAPLLLPVILLTGLVDGINPLRPGHSALLRLFPVHHPQDTRFRSPDGCSVHRRGVCGLLPDRTGIATGLDPAQGSLVGPGRGNFARPAGPDQPARSYLP
jgi:hypothetical protein